GERPGLPVDAELAARVVDVEVAHRELADAVEGSERALGALHRELLRVVREVGTGGVDEGVVVAPTEPEDDLAGDRRADPALERLAQHQRLWVEPATLVHEWAETATHRAVVLDGGLVVDRGDETLVGDVQQRHARRLVDAPALRLDDAVLDLVAHPEAVAAADLVRPPDELDTVVDHLAVDRDRPAGLEADGDVLRGDLDGRVPEPDPHDRVDDLDPDRQLLEVLRLVGGAPDVRVGGVGLLGAVAV